MKNVMLIGALLASSMIYSQTGVKLIGGLYSGMSKTEAKSEFKSNKDTYINVELGAFKYRIYQQNFKFDKNGLIMVAMQPKGTGLGTSISRGKSIFNDLLKFLTANGYQQEGMNTNSGNYFQFDVNGEYELVNEDKTKYIKIVNMPYMSEGQMAMFVWIIPYVDGLDYSKSNSILD